MRNLRTAITTNFSIFLFFFFEFLLIYAYNLLLSISNSFASSSATDNFLSESSTYKLEFLVTIIKISLLTFLIIFSIFGLFRFFIFLNQQFLLYKEELKIKLLLGATPHYISCEFILEHFLEIPLLFALSHFFIQFIRTKSSYLFSTRFPLDLNVEQEYRLANLIMITIFLIIFGLLILVNFLFVKQKVTRLQ
ncbi:hypothetical protein [Carnobacterium gallinarum]|uniref:hypothetical protein n=1 Tax=Carnobacterium gallinarum TaxID=2749 RepID=UPI0014705E4B|nr:hypothetical protein [Carnobacterium gallinarum]